MPRLIACLIAAFLTLLTACTADPPAAVIELDNSAFSSVTPRIVFVTPTREPTPISTVAVSTPVPTLAPMIASDTPDAVADAAFCEETLETLFTQASEYCIGEPVGFFCNGGLAPEAMPRGNVINVSTTMARQGSLVPVDTVSSARTQPLMVNNSGGVMWLRIDDPIEIYGLMLGDVEIRDITPPDANLDAWRAFSVVTRDTPSEQRPCSDMPYSTFVVQGPWGARTDFAVNGVSISLTGSLAIQTTATETLFIAIEGETTLYIGGQDRQIVAGQQLNVSYNDGNFFQPATIPGDPQLLDFERIQYLPSPLFDRPLLLPQPGIARTDGNVNMRSLPTTESRVLVTVPNQQLVSIIGTNPEQTWYHVRLPNGDNGWMRADLVTGDIGEINLIYNATPLPPERLGNAANTAVVVVPQGANLRQAPDVQFGLVRVLPLDTEVEIVSRSPYSSFVKVITDEGEGWLSLITIETDTVVQSLPVDYDVPPPPGPTATPYFAFGGGHAYPDPRGGN